MPTPFCQYNDIPSTLPNKQVTSWRSGGKQDPTTGLAKTLFLMQIPRTLFGSAFGCGQA